MMLVVLKDYIIFTGVKVAVALVRFLAPAVFDIIVKGFILVFCKPNYVHAMIVLSLIIVKRLLAQFLRDWQLFGGFGAKTLFSLRQTSD